MYEGGIREPLIVRWKGHVPAHTTSSAVTGFEDWVPTIMELVGETNAPSAHLDGVSFAPTLLGVKQSERSFLYREFRGYGGQQMVRVGKWKLLKRNLLKNAKVSSTRELYNLASDPSEQKNVAEQNPGIVERLEKVMREQHTASPDFPIPTLDEPYHK
jgi:arylsulfatase A-like enzyme